MFSNTEFIHEWNEIFSFKIKESDLVKPTESFVFTALLNYLGMFKFNTALMLEKKSSNVLAERRAFLVQFCSYIDHMYKISDKLYNFTFWDLMNPSPKKTVHMLNHLLNYLFYYNMFKESVIPQAESKLAKHKEILDSVVNCERGIDQSAMKAKKIAKRMERYREIMPETTSKLNNLVEEAAVVKKDIQSYTQKLQENQELLEHLRNRRASLMTEIIAKDEIEQLLKTQQSLQEAIAEKETQLHSICDNTKDYHRQTMKLQKYENNIKHAMKFDLLEEVKVYKTCCNNRKELAIKLEEISTEKMQKLKVQSKITERLAELQNKLHEQVDVLLPNLTHNAERIIKDLNQTLDRKMICEGEAIKELAVISEDLRKEMNLSKNIVSRTTDLIKSVEY